MAFIAEINTPTEGLRQEKQPAKAFICAVSDVSNVDILSYNNRYNSIVYFV